VSALERHARHQREHPITGTAEEPRRECLDHLLIYGERHLQRTLAEYARHYNEHRPHQSRKQRPPLHEPSPVVDVTARIRHTRVVHGLISEYRKAASRTPETPAQSQRTSFGTAQVFGTHRCQARAGTPCPSSRRGLGLSHTRARLARATRLAPGRAERYRLATYWLPVAPGWLSWRALPRRECV
jgi:hypothetical protein